PVLTEAPGLRRLLDVPDEEAFFERLPFAAAPAGGDALQRRDHLAVAHLDLNRPGILRPRDESRVLRGGRMGDVEHAPAAVPEMREVEIPPPVFLLHRKLEGGLAVQIVIADQIYVVGKMR